MALETVHPPLVSPEYIAGAGRLLCFEKFAEPTSQNKAGAPALARITPLSEL